MASTLMPSGVNSPSRRRSAVEQHVAQRRRGVVHVQVQQQRRQRHARGEQLPSRSAGRRSRESRQVTAAGAGAGASAHGDSAAAWSAGIGRRRRHGVPLPAQSASALAPQAGGCAAAAGSARRGLRSISQASTARFASSTPPSTQAQAGRRRRGGAMRTSTSTGPDARWRSDSAFFSASRMNDMAT